MANHSKVLLINYAGYLLNSNTFIPDNFLGTLAAVLESADIPLEIIDFQNPHDMGIVMENLSTTPSIQIAEFLKRGERPSDELVAAYHYNRTIGEELLLEKSWHNISTKIEKERVKLIGFKLWIGNGLIRAISLAKKIKHYFPDVTLVGGGPGIFYTVSSSLFKCV